MHPCNVCGKTFSIVTKLLQHFKNHFNNENITMKESSEPIFKCDSCDKTFENEDNLNNHEHDSKKVYKCNVCEKAFNDRQSRYNHKRISHEEPTHQCS